MDALFIGQTYIDVTLLADEMPSGDDKAVARDYAVSFGGNAVTAAFACGKLGIVPDLIASLANDWLGRMFSDMAARYGLMLHPRPVRRSSLSFVIPNHGKRAILRARDDNYLHPYPNLNLDGCRALHLDGHQADAAIAYAKACREKGIMTSIDGGGLRANTHDLLGFIDVAVVAERLCEQMKLTPAEMLDYLKGRGCRIGAVTLGERGTVWMDEAGEKRHLAALPVPAERIVDTSGAGDIFHGAYVYSYMAHPDWNWEQHFRFSRAASAHSIQHLGNEASLPTLKDIEATRAAFERD
ncbi:sugar kinase [Phreatobacter sp.]|uniref:sugar kinase n=1 Tax=Phreatobacter sp. TaxID=1966341 RepID=UPI003F71FFED